MITADRTVDAVIALIAETELARQLAEAAGDPAAADLAASLKDRLRRRLAAKRHDARA